MYKIIEIDENVREWFFLSKNGNIIYVVDFHLKDSYTPIQIESIDLI